MVLTHDNDLMMIAGIGGHGTVSGLLDNSCIVPLMLSVTGNHQTRRGDGSPPEIQHTGTRSFVW